VLYACRAGGLRRRLIVGEHVVLFQLDCLLLRRGIGAYLQYDYIGAAWDPQALRLCALCFVLCETKTSDSSRIVASRRAQRAIYDVRRAPCHHAAHTVSPHSIGAARSRAGPRG
jgi:hypothetical protein